MLGELIKVNQVIGGAHMTDANLMAQLASDDPFPALEKARSRHPVIPLELPDGTRIWLVTRYEDARQALTDPSLSNNAARETLQRHQRGPTSEHMLVADPPDHTRLRRLVSAGFTARRVEQLEPRIAEIAGALLDLMDKAGDEADLMQAFAFPLPIQVICELLGVPMSDRDEFRLWSNAVVSGTLAADAQQVEQLRVALGNIVGYITKLIADKRRTPGDDLLSALLQVREQGDRLSEDELVSMVFLMLIAGHETTMNLIGSGVCLLLTHPDQRARLEADPGLLPHAIEEFLRCHPPVQNSTLRLTTRPVTFSGVTVPANELVMVSLLSANRDGTAIPDPDSFDIDRPVTTHLSFGHGIHFCLGAALARLEARIAFTALLERYPKLSLAVPVEELDWRASLFVRGLAKLPVRLN